MVRLAMKAHTLLDTSLGKTSKLERGSVINDRGYYWLLGQIYSDVFVDRTMFPKLKLS